MICQSTNNCPSNIWEHLTPLQHSNTATLANLVLWSVGTWQPRPYILWRTQQGRRQDVSHIVKMILHTHFTWTKHGIKARGRDFNHWREEDWCENLCCAIDPWCRAQLGRHQLLSVESQYKYHKLRTLNCRLEPSSQLVLRAWNDGYPVPEDFTIMEKRLLALSHF